VYSQDFLFDLEKLLYFLEKFKKDYGLFVVNKY